MRRKSITEILRQALIEYPGSCYDVELATGINRASMTRFIKRQRTLRLDTADVLCAFLGIEVVRRKKGR